MSRVRNEAFRERSVRRFRHKSRTWICAESDLHAALCLVEHVSKAECVTKRLESGV